MEEKNSVALVQWKAKKILADLANIPARDQGGDAKAQEFIERYGRLRDMGSERNEMAYHIVTVLSWAGTFRKAWKVRTQLDMDNLGLELDSVFDPRMHSWSGWRPPAIRTDFAGGKWVPVARDLLDTLAIQLVHSRKKLHQCERPECGRCFVKDFSRDRYCCVACGEDMRRRGQYKWVDKHREELKRQRTKRQDRPKRKRAK